MVISTSKLELFLADEDMTDESGMWVQAENQDSIDVLSEASDTNFYRPMAPENKVEWIAQLRLSIPSVDFADFMASSQQNMPVVA